MSHESEMILKSRISTCWLQAGDGWEYILHEPLEHRFNRLPFKRHGIQRDLGNARGGDLNNLPRHVVGCANQRSVAHEIVGDEIAVLGDQREVANVAGLAAVAF